VSKRADYESKLKVLDPFHGASVSEPDARAELNLDFRIEGNQGEIFHRLGNIFLNQRVDPFAKKRICYN